MHSEYLLLMSAALDHETTPAETSRLKSHLRSCATCAETWQRWRTLDARLSGAAVPMAAPDLTERVMARLGEAELRRRRAHWLGSAALSFVVSCAVVLALWGGVVLPWALGHLAQLAAFGDTVLNWLGALGVLARGLWVAVASLGAPTLATAVGALACATCALGAVWLWLLARGGVPARAAAHP